MASKEYPVPNMDKGQTKSSFKPGHGKGQGMPNRPTKTKRAGHRI